MDKDRKENVFVLVMRTFEGFYFDKVVILISEQIQNIYFILIPDFVAFSKPYSIIFGTFREKWFMLGFQLQLYKNYLWLRYKID